MLLIFLYLFAELTEGLFAFAGVSSIRIFLSFFQKLL